MSETSLTDLPFSYGEQTRPATAKPRACRRHEWREGGVFRGDVLVASLPYVTECRRCGKVRDPEKARQGRNNRARGNAIEREVGKALGLRRVGQYGGPDDLAGDLFAVQVKSGGAFSERFWKWLKAVPVNGQQTPLLVVTDAPGPGKKRRAVVVLDLTDWIALHGSDL